MKNTIKILLIAGCMMAGFGAHVCAVPTFSTSDNKQAPLSFIENKGQISDQDHHARPDIQFRLAAANGLNIFIGSGAIHYQFSKAVNERKAASRDAMLHPGSVPEPILFAMERMDVNLVGANKNAAVLTEQKQGYYENYVSDFTGGKGITAESYARITYKDIYPNIDWVLYVSNSQLKHEFIVRTGGRVSDIKLKYGGAKDLKLNSDGSLTVTTSQGAITEKAPDTYERGGRKVPSSFLLQGDELNYQTGDYKGELVIDPALVWCTYYGGSVSDYGGPVSTDASGNVFLCGSTSSPSSIATTGAYMTTYAGSEDAFLVKFSAAGALLWGTYVGGSGDDRGINASTDAAGNVYLCGATYSPTGLATPGAYQTSFAGDEDAFVSKFNSAGVIQWSTFYGGLQDELGYAVAADAAGNVYLGGTTFGSTAGIATPGSYQSAFGGGITDGFLVKFNSTGVRQWATYFGGSFGDELLGIAIDGTGNIIIAGGSSSAAGISTPGSFQPANAYPGTDDGYLAKFTPAGGIVWGTFCGGTQYDKFNSVAVDGSGNIFAAGLASSVSGIATPGAHQTTFAGGSGMTSWGDIMVEKFDNSGARLWGTYYGGSGDEITYNIACDATGNVFVSGITNSTSGIATPGALQTTYVGYYDAVLAEFSSSGVLTYGTYYGGGGENDGMGVTTGPSGAVYLSGYTSSTSGIATTGAYQTTYGGSISDAFIAKFGPCSYPTVAPIGGPTSVCVPGTINLTDATAAGNWTSGNTSVATIGSASGTLTGVSAGVVTISYTVTNSCGPTTVTCNVIVNSFAPVITTMAGTGTAGFSGDGGPATAAMINGPYFPALDAAGNLYFADDQNNRIRKINTAGIITTIAGTGGGWFTGDGGPATAATFYGPLAVALNAAGDIYVTDAVNSRIRKISASTGIITTAVGTGGPSGGDGGPATAAGLDAPQGIAVDLAGNLYICDVASNLVRKVNTSGIITTLAGSGIGPGYSGDGGPATLAKLWYPSGVAVDAAGNVFIADNHNNVVRKVNTLGIISTVVGASGFGFSGDGGPATDAHLNHASSVWVDATGNIFVTDQYNNCVREVNTAGIINTIAGTPPAGGYSGDGGPPTAAKLNAPYGIVGDAAGVLYIADASGNRIRKIAPGSGLVSPISGPGMVCAGSTISLSDPTPGGTWNSDAPGVASVSSTGVVTGVTTGTANISYTATPACGTSMTVTVSVTVNPMPGIISGPSSVCSGSSVTLTDAGGGVWTSASANVSVGSSTGSVTGVSAGNAAITYTLAGGCFTTAPVTVNPLPGAISGPSALCAGTTIVLSDGGGGGWMSSTPAVATVGTSTGVVTGLVNGTTIINYTLPTGCSVTKTVTVSPAPGAISGGGALCPGNTLTLTNTVAGGTWTSSNTSVAGIGSLSGILSANISGTTTVTYSLGGGCVSTVVVTVNTAPSAISGPGAVCVGSTITLTDGGSGIWMSSAAPVASIGSGSGIVSGLTTGTTTINYTLPDGCFVTKIVTVNTAPGVINGGPTVCAGSTITITNTVAGGAWTSSNAGVATIGSLSGILSAIISGTTTVTYTLGAGCTATKVITVNPSPSAISGPSAVCVGASITLTDAGGGSWTSTTTSVAAIGSASGIVSGLASGTTLISYALTNGCSVTKNVTVNTAPGAISGGPSVCAGSTITLANTVPGGTWVSSNTSVATIGSLSGVLSGNLTGTTTVTYSLGAGCTTATGITVNASPATITGAALVCAGSTVTLSDAGGGSWSSSTPGVATVGSVTGIVMGVAAGNARITYTLPDGCIASLIFTVSATPSAISGGSTVCAGGNIALTNTAGGGNWSSSNTTQATIGSISGIVNGLTPGTTTITYTLGGSCSVTTVVTVNSGPASITGVSTLCVGITTLMSDSTTGGVWSIDNPAIGTITASSGHLTGSAAGVATIGYTLGGCTVNETVTVTTLPAPVSGPANICVNSSAIFSDPAGAGTWSSSNASIASIDTGGYAAGAATGVAVITYSLGVGCYVVAPVTVNAGPAPILGATHLCLGNTTVLTDASAGGTWSSTDPAVATITSAGYVNSLSGGTDTIYYTTPTFGCKARLVLPVIDVPAISGLDHLCAWGDTTSISDGLTGGIYTSSMLTVNNLGGGLGLLTGHAPGIGTVTYTVPAGCSTTKTITINTLPSPISGNYHVCIGFTSLLGNAIAGGTWTSSDATIASVLTPTGLVTGVAAGMAVVTYTLPTGCKTDTMVYVSPPPTAISGTGSLCVGASITLSDGVSGGVWSSSNPSVAVAGPSSGIVSGNSPGTATISYAVGAGCTSSVVVTVNPAPVIYTTTGGGTFCAGGAGVHILLSGSQPGVNYQLFNGPTATDTPMHGTGTLVDFGAQPGAGTYTVAATNPATSCTAAMAGTATISVLPAPAVFVVTGGGNYCAGSLGVHIGLAATSTGVSYQLYRGGATVGSALAGTGAALDFGLQALSGTYFVRAINVATSCADTMTGTATVGITPTVTPLVAITADSGTTVCAGTPASFTTAATNGGTSPAYQWKVNNINSGTGTTVFTTTPANGDVISVVMTSNATCPAPSTARDSVTMNVQPLLIPVVSVSAVPGTTITPGQSVTFTATVSNGGTAPAYQWEVNGAAQAGATNATYSSGTLSNNDIVTCVVTSGGQCGGQTGNAAVTITVHSGVGVAGQVAGAELTVIPNPNNGTFSISGTISNMASQQAVIEITDLLGQVVYKSNAALKNSTLNEQISLRGKVANGMYILSVHTERYTGVFHIVVAQ